MLGYLAERSPLIGGTEPLTEYPRPRLYWSQPQSRRPYWIVAAGRRVGFVLVHRAVTRMEIAEFYIQPESRRVGIGLAVARGVFRERPGRWRVRQIRANAPAIAFRHRVLDGFVAYKEQTIPTDLIHLEQAFSIA